MGLLDSWYDLSEVSDGGSTARVVDQGPGHPLRSGHPYCWSSSSRRDHSNAMGYLTPVVHVSGVPNPSSRSPPQTAQSGTQITDETSVQHPIDTKATLGLCGGADNGRRSIQTLNSTFANTMTFNIARASPVRSREFISTSGTYSLGLIGA